MDGQHPDSARSLATATSAVGLASPRASADAASSRRRARATPERDAQALTSAWHGVPTTSRVVAAMESYSLAGGLAAVFAFVAGVLAHSGVVDDAPLLHPFAALAIIASVTVVIGVRIRLLSVMEEACISHGLDEDEAKTRARNALSALGRRTSEHDDTRRS